MKKIKHSAILVAVAVFCLGAAPVVVHELGLQADAVSKVAYPVKVISVRSDGTFQADVYMTSTLKISIEGRLNKIYIVRGLDYNGMSTRNARENNASFDIQTFANMCSSYGRLYFSSSFYGGEVGSICGIDDRGTTVRIADTTIAVCSAGGAVVVQERPDSCQDRMPSSSKDFKKKIVRDLVGIALGKLSR
jgi:hypothetical protein